MRIGFCQPAFVLVASAIIFSGMARAQASGGKVDSGGAQKQVVPRRENAPYAQPTQKERFHIYEEQMFSPYSVSSVMFVSGLQQAEHYPAEWREGWAGFGQRLASNTGTNMANATARYLLSDALKEDARYYRCACTGFWPRLGHAFFSPAFVRRGADGHVALGLTNLLTPYAGPFASVYGWYPSRYDWEAAFRMGNHGLLDEIGTNISLEFLPSILHRRGRRWERRLHLGNPSGATSAP